MYLREETIYILEQEGWLVVCEDPLAIEHEDGRGIATRLAAELLIRSIIAPYTNGY